MAEEQAERTEPATPKRREESRQRGEVAQSRELSAVVVLAAMFSAVRIAAEGELGFSVAGVAQHIWGGQSILPDGIGDFHAVLLAHAVPVAWALLPVFTVAVLAGAAAPLAQTGPLLSGKALKPRWERLHPVKGLGRLVNGDRLFDLMKSVLKVSIVGAAAWMFLSKLAPRIIGLTGVGPGETFRFIGKLSWDLAMVILVVLFFAAIGDLAYQRFRHEKKLRMSRHEVREEARQREGNPQVRQRFRSLHRDLTRQRMIAEVSNADVVVTNPTHYAVALQYRTDAMAAPKVLAKGRGHVALRIREVAAEHGVPIVENPPVARMLYRTAEVGKEIPENLYQAVAEVLAYLHRVGRGRARAWGAPA
jgi:flagellar biosynthetic protein FlhB